MTIAATPPPDLGNVIRTDDVSSKDNGKYRADYINWCRVTHLLQMHAPGWQFHLRPAPDGGHVWAAPNGTAYLVGYWVGPDGWHTPDFPQACQDNRNAPIPLERISARDLSDTHRRALCTSAAAAFGLAWQLWAKEPVEDPHREPLSHDQLVAAARQRCLAVGVTVEGLAGMAAELSDDATTELAELPAELLLRLSRAAVSPETRDRWNAAGQAHFNPTTNDTDN